MYSLTTKGQIAVAIANSGKTPALDVGISEMAFGYSDNTTLAPQKTILRMTVAPNASDDTMFVGAPEGNPTAKVYLRFVIEYWDIFQKRGIDPPHTTMFCGYYPTTQSPFFFNSNGCSTMD
jgi:hypothetical protein